MKIKPVSTTDPRLLEALASLNHISNAINHIGSSGVGDINSSLRLVAKSAIRVVPGSSAVIYTCDQITGSPETSSRVSAEPAQAARRPRESAPNDAPRPGGIGARAIQRRKRILSYQESDVDIHPHHVALGVKAVACFPLIVTEQVVGVLYIYLHEERKFSPLEELLLDNFVNQAAMAIYHARHLAQIQRDLAHKEDELTRLRRAGLLISSRLRLEETLEAILRLALEMTNAQYGIFRLLDKSGQYLVTRAVSGQYPNRPLVEKLPLAGNSIMAYVARSRQPLLIADLRQEPWSKIYYPLDVRLEMLSELAVPLINASGRLEGVLNLESPTLGGFSEDDSHMLQSLATHAITAIQEIRLLDALQDVAQRLLAQPCQQVLIHLSAVASDLLNAPSSAIWLLTETNTLTLAAAAGDTRHTDRLAFLSALAEQAILLKKTITADSVNPAPTPKLHKNARPLKQIPALVVPLLRGEDGQALGAFSVFSADESAGRFAESEWDEKVLTCLANYAALAVQNEARQVALRASQQQHWMAETFAAVGDISANLLHNMNNKVGTIPVRVQAIQEKYHALLENDPYLTRNLAEIEFSAMAAMQIVQENLSHLRPIRLEQVNVAACVTVAIRAIALPVETKIKISGLETLPAVLAGEQSLQLVFKNLIENALDAMNNNGVIVISGAAEPGWVKISVRDSGPGISPALHDQIFELDFSGRNGARPGKLGFGLWWVKTLMTRLGGSVIVESNGKQGSTFYLRLPEAQRQP